MPKTIFESSGTRVGESYSKTIIVTEKREIVSFELALEEENQFIEISSKNIKVIFKGLDHNHVLLIQIRFQGQILEDWKFTKKDLKKFARVFGLLT